MNVRIHIQLFFFGPRHKVASCCSRPKGLGAGGGEYHIKFNTTSCWEEGGQVGGMGKENEGKQKKSVRCPKPLILTSPSQLKEKLKVQTPHRSSSDVDTDSPHPSN